MSFDCLSVAHPPKHREARFGACGKTVKCTMVWGLTRQKRYTEPQPKMLRGRRGRRLADQQLAIVVAAPQVAGVWCVLMEPFCEISPSVLGKILRFNTVFFGLW